MARRSGTRGLSRSDPTAGRSESTHRQGVGGTPVTHRREDQLREIAETSAHLPLTESMSAVVILAQTRSMVADMMQLTGIEYADARELIPDMD